MQTHVSSRVLTCPHVSSRVLTCPHGSSRVLTCPHVYSRILTYTHVYLRILTHNILILRQATCVWIERVRFARSASRLSFCMACGLSAGDLPGCFLRTRLRRWEMSRLSKSSPPRCVSPAVASTCEGRCQGFNTGVVAAQGSTRRKAAAPCLK